MRTIETRTVETLIKGVILIVVSLTTLTEAFLFKSRVCYGKYGCFDRHPVWLVRFPQKPSYIGTKFNLFTRDNRKSAQIIHDDDKSKLEASHFNITRRTIFVIHGFLDSTNTWAKQMKDALLNRENCNVILVDWSRGAKFPYTQAVGNTRLVGAQTAELIRFLISSHSGSPILLDRFYVVGFSLGAHTAGYAGSYLWAHGMQLGRITGLDPAGPLFTKMKNSFRLDESDAQYVDVIYTDAGLYGTTRRCGDIDFYPNGGSRQPGCRSGILGACDHMRAPAYYTASVVGSCSWKACPCADYATFEAGRCLRSSGACASMGYAADRTKRKGIFYLKTNSKAPFCGKTPGRR